MNLLFLNPSSLSPNSFNSYKLFKICNVGRAIHFYLLTDTLASSSAFVDSFVVIIPMPSVRLKAHYTETLGALNWPALASWLEHIADKGELAEESEHFLGSAVAVHDSNDKHIKACTKAKGRAQEVLEDRLDFIPMNKDLLHICQNE